jgi:vancomycin resistance protein VanW
MFWKKDKLFCEISPTTYKISMQKEVCKRHIKNLLYKGKIAKTIQKEKLPVLVSDYSCNLIKRAPGIDLTLQQNKAVNINLACQKINGIIIHPGEEFSFWQTVGKITKRKGYKEGRVIIANKLTAGMGGGLCNLSNTIHLLVLHSPLEVVEFHSHSDALGPDEGKRVPFSAGTSVSYNNVDYKFKNTSDQNIQLLAWCEDEKLFAELRCEKEFPWTYDIIEEDHHFKKEGEKFYRNSKIYKRTFDRSTGEVIDKKLVLDNHSKVMFDYDLIPKELIRY